MAHAPCEKNMMKKVRLIVHDVTQGTMHGKPYFLILREEGGPRKLSVMVGAAEAQSILVTLRGAQVPRPLLHDVMNASLAAFAVKLCEVNVYKVVDGVYHSYLLLEAKGQTERVEARTSDAVALALRMNAPIYTVEPLLERERIYEDGNGAISIPVSSVNIEVLREALERAIREENYELAAHLRDEIARREQK